MKAAQIKEYGGPDVIEINENVPMPSVTPGKVLVKVHAVGLNPFDGKLRAGFMKDFIPLTFPVTLGGDFSGVVVETGEEVYGSAIVLSGGSGALAEFALAVSDRVAKKPKNISHQEAAALPVPGISALMALFEVMKLSKGQKILIHGGAGGIGTYAIRLAKHVGAYVATTVRAEAKEYVKSLGADEVIDYQTQSFESLKDFNAVYDTVGGEVFEKSFQVLKKDGILVSMVEQSKNGSVSLNTTVNTERLTRLAELVEKGIVKVHIDRAFPLREAAAAFAHLETGHPKGKVVVVIAS